MVIVIFVLFSVALLGAVWSNMTANNDRQRAKDIGEMPDYKRG